MKTTCSTATGKPVTPHAAQNRKASAIQLSLIFCVMAIVVLLMVPSPQAQAQTFQVLHTFTGGADGKYPSGGGLSIDRAGNLYGVAAFGGNYTAECEYGGSQTGCGVVFKLSQRGSGWLFSALYSFNGTDGYNPEQIISVSADGSLYGSTLWGGTGSFCQMNCGTVFRLQPPASFCHSISCPWNLTEVHDFQGMPADGAAPQIGALSLDSAGNIYSDTEIGGEYNGGAVYELVRNGNTWTLSLLYSFTNYLDGGDPWGGVILDDHGDVYGTGTTAFDGSGVVFRVSPSGPAWTYTVLHTFSGPDGGVPSGPLLRDSAGNLFGVTYSAGPNGGGTVWELSPNGSDGWTFNLIYAFSGPPFSGPIGGLLMDAAGNLYGASLYNGAYRMGSVFKLTKSNGVWTYTSLHDFTGGSDGWYPYSSLAMDTRGNLYGIASYGGDATCSCGVVFEITP